MPDLTSEDYSARYQVLQARNLSAQVPAGGVDYADLAADVKANLDATYAGFGASFVASQPSGLGWPAAFPLGTVTVAEGTLTGRPQATVGLTPEAAFDSVSTARSAPGATFYVNVNTGSNANDGLTSGTALKSIYAAVAKANTAAVPSKIYVAAGAYNRSDAFHGTGGTWITTDIAFVATGGRVNVGSFDFPGTPSLDATYTNCYSWSVANAENVVDTANLTPDGLYTVLTNVSTPAICNQTPNSWVISGGTLYVRRADGAAVVNANTRVYRSASYCLRLQNDVSCYVGVGTDYDSWDMEGGSSFGVLDVVRASAGSVNRAIVAKFCTFRYGGGYTNTSGRGVSVDSAKGLTYLYGCSADNNQTDGYNAHNSLSASGVYLLTVNCAGVRNGRAGGSSNGWTTHEDVIGADIAGWYSRNSGGTIKSINSSKSWLVASVVERDLGDIWQGGTFRPTAIRVDNAAVYWCERTKVLQTSGHAYVVADTAAIHRRNCWPTGIPDYAIAGATLDTY